MNANVHVPRHMRSHDCGSESRNPTAYAAYVAVFLTLLAIPFVFMPVAGSTSGSEKRELAAVPELVVEGRPNLRFLEDAGRYFSDHFALRSELVDLDATLKQRLFLTSSTDNVVVGTNGWLYYAGTLNDYQRKNSLSDHALHNAADNLALVQEYFLARGKRFVLAVAPNKNGLYPEHMPYYDMPGEGESNLERLLPLLDERGVCHVDLYGVFRSRAEVLYFERDSHWTDQGALVAYEAIMGALGREPLSFASGGMATDEHMGDVDAMLHPEFAEAEVQHRPVGVESFTITNDAESVEDNYIITHSTDSSKQGSLIMYRDSFGNNLMLPFASSYEQAVFTKLVPYDMGLQMTAFANDVVVERTERHLSFFASDPPYLPAPERPGVASYGERGGDTSVYVTQNGPYTVVEGTLDSQVVREDEHVYVTVTHEDGSSKTYEAFRVSEAPESSADYEGSGTDDDKTRIVGDWGYRAYIALDGDSSSVRETRIMVGNEGSMDSVSATYNH